MQKRSLALCFEAISRIAGDHPLAVQLEMHLVVQFRVVVTAPSIKTRSLS